CGGGERRRGSVGYRTQRRRGRSRRLGRGDAGNGRADAAARTAAETAGHEGYFYLGLCRRSVQEELAGRRAFHIFAQTVLAQGSRRGGQRNDGVLICPEFDIKHRIPSANLFTYVQS